ncbi:SDR family NAD(P)-dependent oxidoreductase [Streptomyces thinghirensis]|uniref:SDR family NAD(P)-dependent oxidoreductase n=1 Tax=Streptomyces thinghirensis TaxID=551547 RepID=UPI0031EAB5B7
MTGGTRGIGAAVARRFAADGDEVTVADLHTDGVEDTLPRGIRAVTVDVTRDCEVRSLLAQFARVDVLVNAAGVIARDREYEIDAFERVVAVNLTAAMRCCLAAREALAAAPHGCIVNVASMLSFFGGPRVPAYSASKGGVVQLTKALAVAWAREGIRVNAVAPGWIRTGLTDDVQANDEANRRIITRTPMRRWGEAGEVAGAVAFLAGADAAFVTGTVLAVDGGYLAA